MNAPLHAPHPGQKAASSGNATALATGEWRGGTNRNPVCRPTSGAKRPHPRPHQLEVSPEVPPGARVEPDGINGNRTDGLRKYILWDHDACLPEVRHTSRHGFGQLAQGVLQSLLALYVLEAERREYRPLQFRRCHAAYHKCRRRVPGESGKTSPSRFRSRRTSTCRDIAQRQAKPNPHQRRIAGPRPNASRNC